MLCQVGLLDDVEIPLREILLLIGKTGHDCSIND
jgi:hypothetical protein